MPAPQPTQSDRSCLACSAPIVRKQGETSHHFGRRRSCGYRCAAVARHRRDAERLRLSGVSQHQRIVAKFWTKVDKSFGQDGCWIWNGYRDKKGYGRFSGEGKRTTLAHRFSFSIANGMQPSMNVLHRCDNTSCVNPAHLFLGTHADNMIDKVQKNRQTKGEDNGGAKLTTEDIYEIRRQRASGRFFRSIALDFGVTESNIRAIIHGRSWRHI